MASTANGVVKHVKDDNVASIDAQSTVEDVVTDDLSTDAPSPVDHETLQSQDQEV